MAFNFQLKSETYQNTIKACQSALLDNDVEQGKFYVNRALELSVELINNCQIPELYQSLKSEHAKLKFLQQELQKGNNPFIQKKAVGVPSSEEEVKKEKIFKTETPSFNLNDVAGLEEVKEQIRINVLLPLNDPELYYSYKDKPGCNILMYGPPGCGKSFIAEAIAGELKCPYAIINVPDIMDKYVGEAPKKVKAIFEEAKQYKSCMIFFDEIDALCSSRDGDDSTHTKDILTTFLTCLSGFGLNGDNKDTVRVIIAATNRPWALDSALLRGKRLDTHIYVTLPDYNARLFMVKKAFKKHMNLLEGSNITIEEITKLTDGFAGADITSMIDSCKTKLLIEASVNKQKGISTPVLFTKEAFMEALKKKRNPVTQDMLDAFKAFEEGNI